MKNKEEKAITDGLDGEGQGMAPVNHSLLAAACAGISGPEAAKVTAWNTTL